MNKYILNDLLLLKAVSSLAEQFATLYILNWVYIQRILYAVSGV